MLFFLWSLFISPRLFTLIEDELRFSHLRLHHLSNKLPSSVRTRLIVFIIACSGSLP